MTLETFKGIFGRDSEGDRKELGRVERIKVELLRIAHSDTKH
jgi:hypothetical protein